MHIHKLTIEGLMTYTTAQTLDFDNLPEGVYKIDGPNGAGKSSLLECIHAALYGGWVSRPDLLQNSVNKDSTAGKIELVFTLDGMITYRSVVQVERGKTPEGYLFAGDAPLVRGKISEHTKYIESNILPRALFLSCLYRAQNNEGNFLELKAAQRKEMMNKLLGQEYLSVISSGARANMEPLEAEIADLKASIKAKEEMLASSPSDSTLREELGQAQSQLKAQTACAESYQKELDALNRQLGEIQSQKAAYEKAASSINGLAREVAEALKFLTDLEEREKVAQTTIKGKAKAEEDEKIAAELNATLEKENAKLESVQAAYEEASKAWSQAQVMMIESKSDHESWKRKLEAALDKEKLLKDVPCGTDLHAKCKFVKSASEAASSLKELQDKVDAFAKEYEAFKNLDGERDAFNQAEKELAAQKQTVNALQSQLRSLPDASKELAYISNAETNLKQIQADLPAAQQRLIKAANQHKEAESVQEPPSDTEILQSIGQAASKKQQAEADMKRLMTRIAGLESAIQNRKLIFTGLREVESAYNAKASQLNEWSLLHQAFGKNGIQAVEIDAAGPAISDIANNLLHKCYGNRFSIKFVTTQALKSRAGEKEVYEVMVYDNEHDREAKVESLSGGERVCISIAIQMAIAVYLNQKSGILAKQIVLDECLGALTEENAAYTVQMLRQVLALMGLKHIIIVAHLDALRDYVDGLIRVEKGQVQIV